MNPVKRNVHRDLPLSNERIAACLEETADLLEAQGANPFRVGAYRAGAEALRKLESPAHEILAKDGTPGLVRVPQIGESLARSIEQLAHTGRLGLLERLRGESAPERTLTTVPGIGPALAKRIHDELNIDTLTDLEMAAYDGRLATLAGMGRRRVQAVRESLAGRFRRRPRIPESPHREAPALVEPSVDELLDIDREYLQRSRAGTLPRIAPKRFNPTRDAWLPVLHTERGGRHYTALFSNTARAHELGTTHDWVVIYRDDHDGRGQWTIVTARYGRLRGRRIVRGREQECSSNAD